VTYFDESQQIYFLGFMLRLSRALETPTHFDVELLDGSGEQLLYWEELEMPAGEQYSSGFAFLDWLEFRPGVHTLVARVDGEEVGRYEHDLTEVRGLPIPDVEATLSNRQLVVGLSEAAHGFVDFSRLETVDSVYSGDLAGRDEIAFDYAEGDLEPGAEYGVWIVLHHDPFTLDGHLTTRFVIAWVDVEIRQVPDVYVSYSYAGEYEYLGDFYPAGTVHALAFLPLGAPSPDEGSAEVDFDVFVGGDPVSTTVFPWEEGDRIVFALASDVGLQPGDFVDAVARIAGESFAAERFVLESEIEPLDSVTMTEVTYDSGTLTLSWAPVEGATVYAVAISDEAMLFRPLIVRTTETTITFTSEDPVAIPGKLLYQVTPFDKDPFAPASQAIRAGYWVDGEAEQE